MITIELNDLHFFAFHGMYEEEKLLGNTFVVNASLSFNANKKISTIQQTINYVSVYNIIKQRMQIPTALLETLVEDLAGLIYELDNRIKSVSIAVTKKNLPVANMEGSVSVTLKKEY